MSDPPPITLAAAPVVTVEPAGRSIAALRLAGDWTLAAALPDATAVVAEAARAGAIERLTVDASAVGSSVTWWFTGR